MDRCLSIEFDTQTESLDDMNMRTLSVLALILVIYLFPLYSYATLQEAMIDEPFTSVMPQHHVIGLLADPLRAADDIIQLCYEAFGSEYSLQWYEQYVDPSARFLISKTYDPLLASVLPAQIVVANTQRIGNQTLVTLYFEQEEISLHLTYQNSLIVLASLY